MRFTLTQHDLAAAANLVLVPKFVKIALVLSLLGIPVLALRFHGHLETIAWEALKLMAVSGVVMSIACLYARHGYLRQYRENRKLREETDVEIRDGRMILTQGESVNHVDRTDVHRIRANEAVVILYISSVHTYVFPARVVRDFPALRAWIFSDGDTPASASAPGTGLD